MDLREHLLSLVAPMKVGDAILPGVRLVDASTELGLRLSFSTPGPDVNVEIAPVEDVERFATRTDRLAVSYRSGGAEGDIEPDFGMRLCQAVADIVRQHEAGVLGSLAADAARAQQLDSGGTRIREVTVDRLLERGGNASERFHTLSPYVGCLIGCRFCYAQSRVDTIRRLQMLPEVPWGSYVDVRVNAPEVLARELENVDPLPLKFCPIVSDPYHAIEQRYRLTRRCLETIRDARRSPPTMILTRSKAMAQDADLVASLPRAYAACSIPTADDAVRRHFEPRAASIDDRLELLACMRDAGARTCAVVQPILPGSIEALADALAGVVSSVSIDVLRGLEGAEREFADPRYAHAADGTWQLERAHELARALDARGVGVWQGELPADLH